MGIAEIFQAAAVAAVSAAGNVAKTITYKAIGTYVYDPTKSTQTEVGAVTQTGIKCLAEKYSSREIDGDAIRKTDLKVTIPALSLNVTPKAEDVLTIDSAAWTLVDFDIDAAGAAWIIQVRK